MDEEYAYSTLDQAFAGLENSRVMQGGVDLLQMATYYFEGIKSAELRLKLSHHLDAINYLLIEADDAYQKVRDER